MSLPGPVPYERPRSGSERDAPTKRPMRPYAARLRLADELVQKAPVAHGSVRDSLLTVAQAALFLGAVFPIILAIPGFGSLFTPVASDAGTFGGSGGGWLAAGWWGALLVVVAGVAGVMVIRVSGWQAGSHHLDVKLVRFAVMALIVGGAAYLLLRTAGGSAVGNAAGGALVMLTIVLALFGVFCISRRENWLAAFCAACAVIALTSVLFGVIALVALLVGGRAFPGQVVARHPWKRTEVALEPIAPPAQTETVDGGHHPRERPPAHQGLFIAKVSLVFGGFSSFVLALPWFGAALFGALIEALWPLTVPTVWAGNSLQASFIILFDTGRFGSMVPGAIFTVLWLFVLPLCGALVGARAVGRRTRPWAAVAGALMLILGGRIFFGVAALLAVGYTWRLFGAHPAAPEAHPKDAPPAAPAH